MPEVTSLNTVEFIKNHLTLYATPGQQKLSDADTTVQTYFKAIKNNLEFQETLIKLADLITTFAKKDDVESRLKIIIDQTLDRIYSQALRDSSLLPAALLGIGCGLFGKMIGGQSIFGLITTIVGALSGLIIGALWADKPDPRVVLISLEMTRLLSERFPDSKEKVIQIMGEKLFSKCHLWADMHGGWAQGILNTVNLKQIKEMAQDMMTPSILRLNA